MALLDDVFEAHGGIDRWRGVRRFSVQFSVNGRLLASKGRSGALKDLAAQGDTRRPFLRIAGFPTPERCAIYRPDRVSLETLSGATLARRDIPRSNLNRPDAVVWDDLDLAFYGGISIWNCLVAPFVLAEAGVEVEELAPWRERDEIWRRLKAVFPADAGTLAREQVFHFNHHGVQRRIDYAALDRKCSIAQYSWAHQRFSGLLVPTLHRGMILQPDGTLIRAPRLDIEIFDAQFD